MKIINEKVDTRIISAFPGCGKSTLYNKYKGKCLDSDSSKFDKKDFPNNYIKHIKDNIGKVELIFISSHKEVRDALKLQGIPYTLVYPSKDRKKEFIQNYKNRGNNEAFINLLQNNFENWIDECNQETFPTLMQLGKGKFLEDIIEV